MMKLALTIMISTAYCADVALTGSSEETC